MSRVATATSSELAAAAARDAATAGGNAVDCALAAALVTMNTEPGVCALAGGAYVTVWPAAGDPVTIDGNVAVPGLGAAAGSAVPLPVQMEYGGGVETLVGATSVAVPGTLAAIEAAANRFGRLPWSELLAPSVAAARDGFPLPVACHYYLQYSGDAIFARSAEGHAALHDGGGLLAPGTPIHLPGLADSLECIAREGSRAFYEGDIAAAIVAHVAAGGGRLGREDLARYRAEPRPALTSRLGDWKIAVNPPPAVGGAVLTALLAPFARRAFRRDDPDDVAHLVAVQEAVLRYRRDRLDLSDQLERDAEALLDAAVADGFPGRYSSASTVHTSAVDTDGNACAVTASAGYGSGEIPPGTGLWLNNCLGELELNRRGLDAGPPGRRLPSNMAPGAARAPGRVIAFGSPGADRITTAIQQFLLGYLQEGLSLEDAVAAPRVHVEFRDDAAHAAVEPGLALSAVSLPLREYAAINMFFGGVGAAAHGRRGFEVAADPRRAGGTAIAGR